MIQSKIIFKTNIRSACFGIIGLFLFWLAPLYAQDRILKMDNSIIEAKVLKIGDEEIEYKKFSNLNGPIYAISRKEVMMIVYENGERELLVSKSTDAKTPVPATVPKEPVAVAPAPVAPTPAPPVKVAPKPAPTPAPKPAPKPTPKPAPAVSKPLTPAAKPTTTITQAQAQSFPSSLILSQASARELVQKEDFKNAVLVYSNLLSKDSLNNQLRAEYAYALALVGLYDAAFHQLDYLNNKKVSIPDSTFYTAQVFALTGNTELAKEIWQESDKARVPFWLASNHEAFIQKYKDKPTPIAPNEIAVLFKKANRLAAIGSNFQSISIFDKICVQYPDEFLPYVGYSTVLEKAGFVALSIEKLQKAIDITKKYPAEQAFSQELEKRMLSLKDGSSKTIIPEINVSSIAFLGGMISEDFLNISARYGLFVANEVSIMTEFSIMNFQDISTNTNLGLTVYNQVKQYVSGAGIGLSFTGDKVVPNVKLSVGLKYKNKKKTASFDIFLDANMPLVKGSSTYFSVSYGPSFYFGKRNPQKK